MPRSLQSWARLTIDARSVILRLSPELARDSFLRAMSQSNLAKQVNDLRWEFLRRSEGYRAIWKQWQAIKRKGASSFRLEAESVLLAQRFGLPQLYDPRKKPGIWGPEFPPTLPIRPCSPEEANSRTRYRYSPRLKDDCALLIVDLRATSSEIVEHLRDILPDLQARKAPPNPNAKQPSKVWRGSVQEWQDLRHGMTVEQVHTRKAPHQTAQIAEYLRAWDHYQKVKRYETVARRLFPRNFGARAQANGEVNAIRNAEDYVRKARKLIQNAAAGNWPGSYY